VLEAISYSAVVRLRPSVSLSKKLELGGAVISVHAEANYLEFSMAASVQDWKKKWFYIKDQKTSSSDKFGIAPFDATKSLTKLTSWDSPPTEAEIEDIKPLLSWRRTNRDVAHDVFPAEAHSAPPISCLKALVVL
jgi:hypothetical protein